jgi:hypothetical protein
LRPADAQPAARGSCAGVCARHGTELTGCKSPCQVFVEPKARSRAAGAGRWDAVLGTSTAAQGECSHTCGGPPVAAEVSGLSVHGASAEPPPGARAGARGVPAGAAPTPIADVRGFSGARRGRSAAVPRRVVGRRWRYGGAGACQGVGLLAPPAAARRAVEAVGATSTGWGCRASIGAPVAD